MDAIQQRLVLADLRGLTIDDPPLPQPVSFSNVYNQKAQKSAFEGLGPGSRGSQVTRLQEVLRKWNPRLGVEANGVFDGNTEKAVSLYRAIYSGSEGSRIDATTAGHLSAMQDGSFWKNPPPKTPGQQLLYQASQQIGKPYLLGSDGQSATDCGQLVRSSAGQSGLSRCADEQYRSAKKGHHGLTTGEQPQPGDLLFFNYQTSQSGLAYGGVTHVGIRVNSQWTLAASSSAGRVVMQRAAPMQPYLAAVGNWK
ncbi:C40 family peptidase [bacterium]|nr:C40 family peptidase [bacterium]